MTVHADDHAHDCADENDHDHGYAHAHGRSEADPRARITVRGKTIDVMARRATGAERSRLWQRWLELQPSAEAFRELAGREIPIFVLARRAASGRT